MNRNGLLAFLVALLMPALGLPSVVVGQSTYPTVAGADTMVLTQARTSIRAFVLQWRGAWMRAERGYEEERIRRRRSWGPMIPDTVMWDRLIRVHCHANFNGEAFVNSAPMFLANRAWDWHRIGSIDAYGLCMGWAPAFGKLRGEERTRFDDALLENDLDPIVKARVRLIGELQTAAGRFPADSFIAGQLVRFLVDARSMERALDAARACRGGTAWCGALVGYVQYRRGEILAADSSLEQAWRAREPEIRCTATRIGILFSDPDRETYHAGSCPARETIEERVWWLADPFFADPGNERRVEHRARQVLFALHAALDEDERFDLTPRYAHLAEAIVVRYGWPSYFVRGTDQLDEGHAGYLSMRASHKSPPYFSPEYSSGRVAVLPTLAVQADPFSRSADDWKFRQAEGPELWEWWPVEHFAPRTVLRNLETFQLGFLRRQDSTLLALATAVPTSRALGGGPAHVLHVMHSTAPKRITEIRQAAALTGAVARLSTAIESGPALLSLEALPTPERFLGEPRWRARMGVSPPPALRALAPTAIAVSDPLFLRAASNGTPVSSAAAAIGTMLPSTALLQAQAKVGLYWESYGIAPGDTVVVALSVTRTDQSSALARLGSMFGIGADATGTFTVSWTEPRSRQAVVGNEGGRVPVQGRGMVLDIGQLPVGSYMLRVQMTRTNGVTAFGQRAFTVEQ